jgi:ATP-dependent Clp protease ATP-binding subunit ClpC
MKFSFDYSNRRSQKARMAGFLGKRTSSWAVNIAIVALIVIGCGFMFTGTQGGALLAALGAMLVLMMLWYHGDLKKQDAVLTAGETIALDQALDKYVLARLPKNPSANHIWRAVKGHWHQDFFRVRYGIDNVYIETQLEGGQIAPDAIWSLALELSHRYNLPAITPGAIVVALFLAAPAAEQVLNTLHLQRQELEDGVAWLKQLEDTFDHVRNREQYGGLGRDWANGYTPLLSKMAHNVSLDIQHGRLFVHTTPTREQVVEQMLAVLSKSSSGSVALVGEFGSGKTTAVLALAQKLLTQNVPSLRYHQIFNLDASVLMANAGNFQSIEELVLRLMSEANRAGNVILFLDEAQLFMRTGTGSVDLTNILLQVLQSGRIHLICALTPIEWQHIQMNNTALAALMHQLVLPPAEHGEAVQIMQDQLLLIEHKHKVVFTFQAIQEAYRLAEKYIHEQAFPGRGIQVLEEAAVFSGGGLIAPEVIGKSLESKLGVKVVAATASEGQQLLRLEDELHKQLINQIRAVSVVANALRRSRSGVGNPDRPVGSFLFLGPTGVGKTELAKALADVYFHGRDQIIRINLNEYTRAADAARLLASGTDQSSSGMLDAIRRQPYSVVLMDEIEKAHPDMLNLFLQLLDEGILKDANGREASFKDAIVIATSNAGADMIRAHIDAGQDLEQFEGEFVNKLIDQNLFKPEFLNRFDEIVLFRPLKPEELSQVVQLMISEVNKTLERQKVRVALSESAISWLVEHGNDPRLGARPMRRMIQRSVENIVAKKLLGGEAGPGSEITLDVADLAAANEA